jgi:hypothetical protein
MTLFARTSEASIVKVPIKVLELKVRSSSVEAYSETNCFTSSIVGAAILAPPKLPSPFVPSQPATEASYTQSIACSYLLLNKNRASQARKINVPWKCTPTHNTVGLNKKQGGGSASAFPAKEDDVVGQQVWYLVAAPGKRLTDHPDSERRWSMIYPFRGTGQGGAERASIQGAVRVEQRQPRWCR